jgi:TolB-like protein
MICSSSCSGRRLPPFAAAVLVAALTACGHARARPEAATAKITRLAVFPVQNASGGAAPIRPLSDALESELVARGVPVIPRRELDAALANHRIRFTGGVDRPLAKVFREDLNVDAVLVSTLEQYSADDPPRVALTVRIVGTEDRPVVLWAGGMARSGNDAPGLLGRGRVTKVTDLQAEVVAAVARSVEGQLASRGDGGYCGDAGRFTPRRKFRAPVLDDVGRRSIAVLPFTNHTSRRAAADVVAGQFVAQLARSGAFEVLDPGLVREELLAHHIVLESGVSLDNAQAMLDLLQADLVLSGYVEVFEANAGTGAPKAEFTAYVLDKRTGELVWSSASTAAGDDGVWFFRAGEVYSVAALSCRMVRGAVDAMVGHRPPLEAAR